MIALLLLGISYGFTAGVSPGPMLGLVIAQTLQRGWRVGNLVALAPLFSDLPIVTLAVVLVDRLPPTAFGWLGVIGGLFVVYLGIDTLRTARHVPNIEQWLPDQPGGVDAGSAAMPAAPTVIGRAVLTNMLNPHPYLFWGTVGAQLIIRSYTAQGPLGTVAFLVGFYTLLVGSKLLVALLVHHSRGWLRGPGYRRVLLGSGILLIALGLLLIRDGVLTLPSLS